MNQEREDFAQTHSHNPWQLHILSYIQRGNIHPHVGSSCIVRPRFWTSHRPHNTAIAWRFGSVVWIQSRKWKWSRLKPLECVWSVCTCDSSWVVADSLLGGSAISGVHSLPGASLQLLQCLHGTFIGWWETFSMWVFGQRHCMLSALNLADLKGKL